jgi:hypothetical protein
VNAKDIKVGMIYCNRGAGRTKRTVLDIGEHVPMPPWFGAGEPEKTAVLFEQNGKQWSLCLKSFASWAGEEVGRAPQLELPRMI